MLLNASEEEHTDFSKLAKFAGLPLALALTASLAALVLKPDASIHAPTQAFIPKATEQISSMLFKEFVYPFELTSFLILVAIMGALVLAQREKK
jgi:NADH-quinone oxidoreductase subunit J